MPIGAKSFSEGIRMVAEVFHTLKTVLEEGRPQHRRRRRGRLRPEPRQRGGHQVHPRRRRQGRLQPRPRQGLRHRPRLRLVRAVRRGREEGLQVLQEQPRQAVLDAGDDRPVLRLGRQVPDRLDRGPARPGRLGRLSRDDQGARRQGAARRRRPLRHQRRRAWPRASSKGCCNSILVKVNQIGTLTETLDAVTWPSDRSTRPSSATAPARPRTRRSPTSPSPPTAARSRPAAPAAPTASRSTTSSSASRRNSAPARCTARGSGRRREANWDRALGHRAAGRLVGAGRRRFSPRDAGSAAVTMAVDGDGRHRVLGDEAGDRAIRPAGLARPEVEGVVRQGHAAGRPGQERGIDVEADVAALDVDVVGRDGRTGAADDVGDAAR